MEKLWDRFLTLYKSIVVIMLGATVTCVSVNVFFRYVLSTSLGWVYELSRYLFIYTSLMAAALAYYYDEHIACEIFTNKISNDFAKLIMSLVKNVFIFIVLLFLIKNGWVVYKATMNFSPILSIPLKYVYVILPISAFLMLIINIAFIIKDFKAIIGRFRVRREGGL